MCRCVCLCDGVCLRVVLCGCPCVIFDHACGCVLVAFIVDVGLVGVCGCWVVVVLVSVDVFVWQGLHM